jgi:hypothetical protein
VPVTLDRRGCEHEIAAAVDLFDRTARATRCSIA